MNGSAISVGRLSNLMIRHIERPYSHSQLRDIFSVNRQVVSRDLDVLRDEVSPECTVV